MQINIDNPQLQTVLFSIIFITAIMLSVRKLGKTGFSIHLTQELKGFAILAIIFSHIGYFLSSNTQFLFPLSIMAGVAVNLFLFLSGFGLTISALNQPLSIRQFYQKRLVKLFLPLWIVVLILLWLDWIILSKSYSPLIIVQSLVGWFPKADLYTSLNAPFWYFTYILFYYLLFPLSFFKRFPWISPLLIWGATFVVFRLSLPTDPSVIAFYQIHSLAFPLGMIYATLLFHKKVQIDIPPWVRWLGVIVLCAPLAYLSINSGVGAGRIIEQSISTSVVIILIAIFILKPFQMRLLRLYGIYSYEMFLIHWPLAYRFDFLYKLLPGFLATSLYLVLVLGLSFGLSWLINQLAQIPFVKRDKLLSQDDK